MTEAKTAATQNGLCAALAKVQAELPAVAKNQTGEIKGTTKDGKPYSYDYKYADLDAVSDAIIPLLGKHGLSFTAEPGSDDQDRLVLKYALLHESGEERPGQFPLWLLLPPRFTAQTVGGLITYGRRYCLCAVTGVAPGGDSDAAGIGETTMDKPRSRPALPAAPAAAAPARSHGPSAAEAPDESWGDWPVVIDAIASPEDAEAAKAEVDQAVTGGRMDDVKAAKIKRAMTIKGNTAARKGGVS
jgi:ERF superfamily